MCSFPKVDLDLLYRTLDHTSKEKAELYANYTPLNIALKLDRLDFKSAHLLTLISNYFSDIKKKKKVHKKGVENILLVLAANKTASNRKFIGYSRTPTSYKRGYYNPHNIGYTLLIDTLEALVELGFIKKHIISPRSRAKERNFSRFELSDRFKTLIKNPIIENSIHIYMKDADKKLIEVSKKDTAKLKKLNKRLTLINQTLLKSTYTIEGTKYHPPQLKRVFNRSSLKYGGRFYVAHGMPYITFPGNLRKKLEIDDKQTIEVDFDSLHPNLLYSMAGTQLKFDPYKIEGYERKEVKLAFIIALNSNNLRDASKALSEKRNITYENSKKLILNIIDHNPIINKYFFQKDISLKLQNKDSLLAQNIILNFIDATNSPILPIHDSFIIKKQFQSTLKSIMKNSYSTLTNFNISIS